MLQVSEILRVKGNTLYTASPETQVVQALETMSVKPCASSLITSKAPRIAGGIASPIAALSFKCNCAVAKTLAACES